MTDRIKGLVVTLDKDYRDDDVESIVHAICMIKGVLRVDTSVTELDDHMNRNRIRCELERKIHEAIHNED